MKKFYYIIFITFVFLSEIITAQTEIKDTLTVGHETKIYFNRDIPFLTNDNSFRISTESFLANTNILMINDPSTIQLRTKFAIMNGDLPYGPGNNNPSDLLHPYYEFYLQKQDISLFNKVIGIAQLGAVGYLAYKHIKKYGLFH